MPNFDPIAMAIGDDTDATDYPATPIETAVVVRDTPREITVSRDTGTNAALTFGGLEQLETAIEGLLNREQEHNRSGAICALRCGALFHVYKRQLEAMAAQQRGQVDFYVRAVERFNVSRGTINRRMRLVVLWAKENRLSEGVIAQLADTTEQDTPEESEVLQMAFDFVGESNTTDLYRKYKLLGSDTPKRKAKAHITVTAEVESDRDQLLHTARETIAQMRSCLTPGYLGQLDASTLEDLEAARLNLGHAIAQVRKSRKNR